MQRQYSNGGEGQRGRWPLEHGPSHRDPSTTKIGGLRGGSTHQSTVPHARWNNSEWKRWDQNHGHMLWMGTLQEDWNNAIIAGFFRYYGEEVTVTRKGQDNYCFVEFATTEKATEFMTKYNHRMLPGKHGDGIRFSIKPRTRPRWYRDNEPGRREGSQGDGNDDGNHRDLRTRRLNPEHDRRGEGRRPTFATAKTETRSGKAHQDDDVRGVGTPFSEGRGYYTQGIGDRGLHVPGSGRGGREARSPRTTPPLRQHAAHGEEGELTRRDSCKDPRRACSRSRLRPGGSDNDSVVHRSRPTSRMLSRLGPSPSRGSGSSDRGRRNNRSIDGCRTRKHQDPSFRQARTTFDGGAGASVTSNDSRIPAAAATPMGSRGDEGSQPFPKDGRARVLRGNVRSDDTPARDERDIAAETAGNAVDVDRMEESTRRWSAASSGMVEGGRAENGSGNVVGGAGREGRNSPVLSVGSGSSEGSSTESDSEFDDRSHASGTGDGPEQGIALKVERGFHGVEHERPAVPSTALDSDEESSGSTASSEQAGRRVIRTLGRDNALEERSGWKRHAFSPSTAGTQDSNGPGTLSSPGKANRCSVSTRLGQGPKRSNEACPTTATGARAGRRAGSTITPHDQDNVVRGDLNQTDGLQTQHLGKKIAKVSAGVKIVNDASSTIGSADKQTARVCSATPPSIDSVASERDVSDVLDQRGSRQERGALRAGTRVKGKPQKEETGCNGNIPTAPPAGSSSSVQSARSKLRHHAEPGSCVAPRTGSTLLFSDSARRLHQAQEFAEGTSTKDWACSSTPRDGESVLTEAPPTGDGGSTVPANQVPVSRNRSIEASPGAEKEISGDAVEGYASRNLPTPKLRRGTKRRISDDVNLTEVADPPAARQRLEERVPASTGSVTAGRSRTTNVAPLHVVACADNSRGSSDDPRGKEPSTTSAPDVSRGGEAVWARGRVPPLAGTPAPREKLVAPVLATAPGGRRSVIRTAAAVAAGAAMLALPRYRLEVTGLGEDGLLLELSPTDGGKGQVVQKSGGDTAAVLHSLADRLQAAFDGIVALDLQFDGVKLPHSEALRNLPTGSSTEKLMKWGNEDTATLLRLSPGPLFKGASPVGQAPGDAEITTLLGLRKALKCAGGKLFIGCGDSSRHLLPRSGLLKSYKVDIHPVVYPPFEPAGGGSQAYQHLAMTLSDSREGFNAGGSLFALRDDDGQSTRLSSGCAFNSAIVGPSQLNGVARRACGPPTFTAEGLTWREVTNLRCVADVNRLVLGPRADLNNKLRLAEGLHSAQIEALAKKIALSNTLLVVLAGRQGASTDFVASRLCVDLRVRGKTSALLDTKKFLRPGTGMGPSQTTANTATPFSRQHLDSTALARAVAALLGQTRAHDGVPGVTNGGGGSMVGSDRIAGAVGETRQWCDVVLIFGCEMLDLELLPAAGLGLGPTEAMSVFVDVSPQVSVDNLTAVDGADVRMLRALLTAANAVEVGLAHDSGNGSFSSTASSTPFDAASFLHEWCVAEQTGKRLWRSFHAAANFHVNTALPYDLNALKPNAEPLLRSVTPPVNGCGDEDGGHGSHSEPYTISRSVMRLLRLCESLYAPQMPGRSVLSGLTVA